MPKATIAARKIKRYECAEEVCKAYRQAVTTMACEPEKQQQYYDAALGWLIRWMDHAPKGIKYADHKPIKRRSA